MKGSEKASEEADGVQAVMEHLLPSPPAVTGNDLTFTPN